MNVLILLLLMGVSFGWPVPIILAMLAIVTILDLLALMTFKPFYRLHRCPICGAFTLRHGLMWWFCTSGRHGKGAWS
jgi:hypothetical protein